MDEPLNDQLSKRPSLVASVILEGSKVFPHRKGEGNKNKARKAGAPKEKLMALRGQTSIYTSQPHLVPFTKSDMNVYTDGHTKSWASLRKLALCLEFFL